MGKPHPTIQEREIEVQTLPLKMTIAATVIQHGAQVYVKLPKTQAEYYDIQSGDTLLISLLELRRIKEEKQE